MAKDYKNPEEFDPAKLTEEAVNEAIKEVEEKWHSLGTGVKVKEKLTEKMEDKLTGLVNDAKSGNWKRHMEEAIVQMITYNYSSNESLMWYGHLITQCEIKRDLSMPSPAGVRFMFNKYEMFINPLLFGLYTTDEQIAILKHEMLHIINLHIVRQKDKEHKKWNYGTDISINQLIKNIPADGLQPEKFEFEKNLNAEQYYEMIPVQYTSNGDGEGDCASMGSSGESGSGDGNDDDDGEGEGNGPVDNEDKLKDMIYSALKQVQDGMVGDHSKWNESEGDEQAAKEITRQMTETATNKSRGMSPAECSDAIAMLKMKEQINWKKELRRIVGNRKAFSKLTIKKNDRRFPERRDLRGKTRDHVADILVILDVSGSMSDEELLYGLNETRAIAEKAGAGVKIMQVDTEPKLVEEFDPKAKNFTRRGFGGTYLYPAVEFAMENKVRFDAIVMVTDGYIEQNWDGKIPKVPFIWLVTQDKENLSLDIGSYSRMKAYTLEIDKKS
jgi:predicted metal-dependent peptidase